MPRPSTTHLVNRLRQLTLVSPSSTALFYARIWYALLPPTLTSEQDHESLHVLALCMLQTDQPYSALHLVRDLADGELDDGERSMERSGRPRRKGCYGCAMIVGKCCDKLGRYSEGKAVVERAIAGSTPMTLPVTCPASTSASAYLMLASMSSKGKAPEQAIDGYTKALQEDPWLWEAFTGLCDVGSPPSPDLIFPDPPAITRSSSSRTSRPATLSPNPMPRSSASEMPAMPRRQLSPLIQGAASNGFFTPDAGGPAPPRIGMLGNPAVWETPSGPAETPFGMNPEPALPVPSRRPLPSLTSFIPGFRGGQSSNTASTPMNAAPVPSKPPAMKRPRGGHGVRKPVETPQNGLPMPRNGRDLKSIEPNGEEGAPVRRSSRLKAGGPSISSKTTRDKRGTRSRSATSSASGATIENPTSPQTHDVTQQSLADDWLRDIVRKCARAYRALSMYSCQEAITEIDTLPSDLQVSPWALDIVSRAFYEMSNYVLARRAFQALLNAEPYTLHSMERYSTLLWHLGDPPALSHLAQNLIAIDKEAPQSWIAAGNLFSAQRDGENAMRCFRRATQVDPGCAYAWTLCGYEAIEMEEYDRAIAFYRTAIRTDTRHYNAWYGLGLVYLKTGKPKYAEHHFRRAAEINPTNAGLLCCVGSALEQSDETMQALTFYDQACKYAPDSPMVAYKRIRVLVALQRVDEAVQLLESLCRTAPDEANIHFLLAKCYLKQGRRSQATVAFTSARELQPKLESAIKVAMGGGGAEDDEEEEDTDM